MLQIDRDRPPSTPKHASTVILLREAASGFEVFMVRRHTRSGFMGGAYVFPGGKLDDADADARLLARLVGRSPEQAAEALGEPDDPTRAVALHVAALRETFEEAGVLLAETPAGAALSGVRRRLLEGAPFPELVEELDALLHLDRMTPFARWLTPAVEPRRYDTRFFVAVAPPEQEPAHDRRETTEAAWMTPAGALERERRGEIQLPPPTLRTLEQLSAHPRLDVVLEEARSQRPPFVDPVFVERAGAYVLALPGDPDHPTREPAVPGPTHFTLADGRWHSGDPP